MINTSFLCISFRPWHYYFNEKGSLARGLSIIFGKIIRAFANTSIQATKNLCMRKFYVGFLCVNAFLFAQPLIAQVKIKFGCTDTAAIWTGLVDNNWNNPSNWNTGCVPTVDVSVLIQPGGNPLIGSDGGSVKRLTMQAGATLGLDADAVLEVISHILNDGTILSGPAIPTNGKVLLNGLEQQNISGTGSFSRVEVENSVGVRVLSNVRIKSLEILANGKLTVAPSVNLEIR